MSEALELGGILPFCEKACREINDLRHGKSALLITLATAVAAIALPFFCYLFGAGYAIMSLPVMVTSIFLFDATVLLGPKVFYDYIPGLLKMILNSWRSQPVVQTNGIWKGKNVATDIALTAISAPSSAVFSPKKKPKASSILDAALANTSKTSERRLTFLATDLMVVLRHPRSPRACAKSQDLSVPFRANKRYDWVISLEVGEHLPKQCEHVFIDNLVANAEKGIVLSWAKKGQGGHGHVNEQNNDYIKAIFLQKGWVNDTAAETRLRQASSPLCFWFYDTIMVFRRPS